MKPIFPAAMNRRQAAQLLVASAFAGMMPFTAVAADGQPARPGRRIDLHNHFLPSFYREALAAAGLVHPDGIKTIPEWSEAALLATMDDLAIDRTVISVSSPGVYFGDAAAARRLSRQVNEEGARLAAAHPGRIDFFASTPLPDVLGAVAEVVYALDHLGAAGIIFESNFAGLYLGDAELAPVYAELDKRGALLFVHPTTPNMACGCAAGTHGATPVDLGLGYSLPMIEFIFETTRSVTNMVMSGTFAKYPNLKLLVPHAGAALPLLSTRIDTIASLQGKGGPRTMRDALRRIHFDLAGMPVPDMLTALLAAADHSKIHFGSDWPYTPIPACHALAKALDETPLLSPSLRADIMYGNSEALLRKAS